MLTPAATLRRKLDAGETVVGVMATDHAWPFLVEICQQGGLDYLVVDREHGPHSDETVAQVCEVGRLAGFPVLMRTASTGEAEVRRALDLGPCGLVLPGVETAGQLDEVRDAIFLPPRGRRRPGGMGNYWLGDYHAANWRAEFEEHFLVVPQIESRRGVENADAIATHEIVTALGLGPYDLSADLGCCWDPEDARHREAVARVRDAADRAGRRLWMAGDPASLVEEGYTFLWIGSVSSILREGFASAAEAARGELP